jgi:hypothetical protein
MPEDTKKPFDRNAFNTDPKHEAERNQLDAMLEDSFNRITERKRKETEQNQPKEPENIFDALVQNIFGNTK